MDSQTFNIQLPSISHTEPKQQPLSIEPQSQTLKKSTQLNNLFNKLIAYNYQSKFIKKSSSQSQRQPQLDQDIIKFFQILLWSQKKYPQLVIQLFQMCAIEQIQEIHLGKNNKQQQQCMGIFLKAYILVLGNCKQGGVLAQLLLDHRLPHIFLTAYLTQDKNNKSNNNNKNNKQQQDQKLTYIGSFLKSYHRIFRNEWFNKFIINQQYFELLQISLKFYNCPQPLTRTTVFNVVLDLFSYSNVQKYINNQNNNNGNVSRYEFQKRRHFYESVVQGMVKKFRKQLYLQGQRILKIQNQGDANNEYDQIIKQIDDKISEWQDISRICSKIPKLFRQSFTNSLLLPLLISPIKPATSLPQTSNNNKPMVFTIKYSLLILKKLIKTIINFDLMDVLLKYMFGSQDVYYYQWQQIANDRIQKQKQKQGQGQGFRIQQLIDIEMEINAKKKDIVNKQINTNNGNKQNQMKQMLIDQQIKSDNNTQTVIIQLQKLQNRINFGSGIKKFFQNILKTKDNYFLLSITIFLSSLYQTLSQSPLLQKHTLKPNQPTHTKILQKLLTQLSQTHRLITIQSILNTIIILQEQKPLTLMNDSNLASHLLHIFMKVIEETKMSLKSKSQLWDFIVEINQYDLMRVNQVKFGKSYDNNNNNNNKYEEIYKVIFMRDIKNQENVFLPFYSCIPQTSVQQFRYIYNKYLLMRKAMAYLIQGLELSNLASDYYSKFILNPPYNPGETLSPNQLKQQFQQCQIIDGKFTIPALWIVNEDFLILAHHDKSRKQIKIILTIKYKHISTELKNKKDKLLTSFSIKIYDYKSQRLKYRNSISVKGIEALMFRFIGFQIRVKQKQMVFIQNHVKKTEQLLPKISLI